VIIFGAAKQPVLLLAIIALDGGSVPREVTPGSRIFTKENVAQGGEAILAP